MARRLSMVFVAGGEDPVAVVLAVAAMVGPAHLPRHPLHPGVAHLVGNLLAVLDRLLGTDQGLALGSLQDILETRGGQPASTSPPAPCSTGRGPRSSTAGWAGWSRWSRASGERKVTTSTARFQQPWCRTRSSWWRTSSLAQSCSSWSPSRSTC